MMQMLVYFGIIAHKPQGTLYQASPEYQFETAIQEMINPDVKVIRYGRTWRFSQPKVKNRCLVGKLGFISSGQETRVNYDENVKDFIEQTVSSPQSTFVLWAIDLSEQNIAFEVKLPDIKYQSFKGAFNGILDERSDIGLTMEDIVETSRFIEWVESVDRVVKFTANLRAPNPDFSKHPKLIRELLEDTNADRAKVELIKTKESSDSLDTENTIKELVEYGEEGYSSIIARGEKEEQTRIFDSRRKTPLQRADIPDDANEDMKWDIIIRLLRDFRK